MNALRLCIAMALLASLLACASNTAPPADPEPLPAAPAVGAVALDQRGIPAPRPDLAVVVFDQGVNADSRQDQVFPTLRKAESLLLPVNLSDTLDAAGAFGVVRVVHSPAVDVALRLEGQILRADGAVLELHMVLRDASGAVLLDRAYRDEAADSDYPIADGRDPFADLYHAISNDVVAIVRAMPASQRDTLQRLALVSFGVAMAPDTFRRFIDDEDGGRRLVAYPADGDPMLRRLQRLRRQDDLFIDAVDEQYSDLRDEVAESYGLWREYSYELQRYGDSYRSEARERKRNARRGTYAAMQQVYGTFRKVKIQEEDLRDLVDGFVGESLETVLEVDDGVFRLSGSVEDRYAEWRRILSRIDALETGGVAP